MWRRTIPTGSAPPQIQSFRRIASMCARCAFCISWAQPHGSNAASAMSGIVGCLIAVASRMVHFSSSLEAVRGFAPHSWSCRVVGSGLQEHGGYPEANDGA